VGLTEPKIYLDSCIAIYLVEEHAAYSPRLEALLESLPSAEIFVSDLAVMECLVKPYRDENVLLIEKFDRWFHDVVVLPVTFSVFTDAARLRADHPTLKTPDAIHLATALSQNCDEFWTNDGRLDKLGVNIVRNVSEKPQNS
jgi:predicted nucleic acid-binding protein